MRPGKEPKTGEKKTCETTILSPILAILYALVLSLIGFDLVMSLSPHWHSTLFGMYFFTGGFYSGLAALSSFPFFRSRNLGMEDFIQRKTVS